jgi:colicin import membrane protein
MMNLLLKYEGYPPSVVAALCLHALLLWIIFEKDFEPSEYVQIEQPMMAATAVQQNPQKLRRLEELQLQRQRELDAQRKREADQQAARQREAEAQRAREAEQRRVAEQRQQELQRQQEQERQRLAQQEADRQAREKAAAEAAERSRLLAEQQRQQQAAEAAERQRLSQQNEAQAAEANIVSQYVSIIQNLIRQNWVIPPSARCNMVAVVELRLTPVGDVVNNTIVQSSGDAAFDRSVLQAVDRVGSFPEVRELPNPVFERNFRRFTLTFQPQDLLRC